MRKGKISIVYTVCCHLLGGITQYIGNIHFSHEVVAAFFVSCYSYIFGKR